MRVTHVAGLVIIGEKDWGLGRPQVAMHRELPTFLVAKIKCVKVR